MTPEAQRIAIAEACGWEWHNRSPIHGPQSIKAWHYRDTVIWVRADKNLPRYLTDLNAMHDAEKVLTLEQDLDYSEALERVVGGRFNSNNSEDMRRLRSATAAQRAEAFLRTLGKWEESP